MAHEFLILLNGELVTYTKYEDIPETFDNLIRFVPEIPEPPHTHDQHEEIDSWNYKLKELMKRETNGLIINN
jgi:hypothetical protein